jgi:hypothetical protein
MPAADKIRVALMHLVTNVNLNHLATAAILGTDEGLGSEATIFYLREICDWLFPNYMDNAEVKSASECE